MKSLQVFIRGMRTVPFKNWDRHQLRWRQSRVCIRRRKEERLHRTSRRYERREGENLLVAFIRGRQEKKGCA